MRTKFYVEGSQATPGLREVVVKKRFGKDRIEYSVPGSGHRVCAVFPAAGTAERIALICLMAAVVRSVWPVEEEGRK